jgi:long-chain fatty acid transport protein
LSYRSAISYTLTGDAAFGAAPVLNGNVTADLKLPDSLSVHGFTSAGKNWEFMFDVTLTRWSHLDTVTVLQTTGLNAGGALATLVYRWRNTRTVGIGANYKLTEDARTKVRFGIGYDQTPTTDTTRSPDLPEQDSLAFTLGLHHKNPAGLPGAIDVGFMYQRIKDAAINASTSPPIPGSALIGTVQNKGPIFAIQYSGSFK